MPSAPFPSHTNNLPALLSSFIGRQAEIGEVRQLLRTQRLVTLTAAGGFGKTRLALQVAASALPAFEDGVWLVELASLADPTLVPQTVASALGVREQSGRPLVSTLSDYLRPRHLLLVLDNCEHLVQACAEFAATLLQACPGLTILATSREPLGIDGETVWSVPPLSLPEAAAAKDTSGRTTAAASQPQSEAVQLFVARAEAAVTGFTLTAENAASVEEICRRLDGMPLAIELAAARLRALTVQQVADHQDDRFHLLTGGSRTAPARQRTLEAALDWSYALLSEPERKVLQRLSVFAGGCNLQAATAVCSGKYVAAGDVLDHLSHLVDKSLLEAETAHGEARYRMLDTIREYAGKQLSMSGDLAAARDRHLQYFLEWAESAEPFLHDRSQISWLERFEVEHDNLRAALEWSRESEDAAESGLRLAAVVGIFWGLHGYHTEGRMRLAGMLARKGVQDPKPARARALYQLGILEFFESDYPAVHALMSESLAIWRAQGASGRHGVAMALEMLAETESEIGNFSAAFPLYEQALALYRELGNLPGIGNTLKMLGWSAMRTGDYERADPLLSEGLSVCRQAGEPFFVASALAGLGELALRRGQLERAGALLRESLEISRSIGDKWSIPIALGSLAWLALEKRDFESLRSMLGESLSIRAETEDRGGIAWCLEKFAHAAILQLQYPRAATLYAAAAALRAPVNSKMDAADEPEYERNLAAVGKAVGEEAFKALWEEGRHMPVEAMINYALQEAETRPATRQKLKEDFGGLTSREREVAAHIAQGKSNRDIAQAMTVGVKTIETYVTRILNKLGFDSRVQIATWAVEKGLRASNQQE